MRSHGSAGKQGSTKNSTVTKGPKTDFWSVCASERALTRVLSFGCALREARAGLSAKSAATLSRRLLVLTRDRCPEHTAFR